MRHTLDVAVFDALARGSGGAGVARVLVAARRSRTLLFIRLVVGGDARATRAFEVLGELRRTAPSAVNRVLDDPVVGAWATAAVLRQERGERTAAADLAFAAAAAAIRAGAQVSLDFPRRTAAVLPSLGAIALPSGGVHRTDCLEWTPFRVISPATGVAWTVGGWPEGLLPEGLGIATETDRGRWTGRLRAAWSLLAEHHRPLAEELAATITAITPLARTSAGDTSATVSDALGCVFLSLGEDPESLAATLVHELHHARLTVLTDLFPFFDTGNRSRFYAPWRPDPRPLPGLLHGTYAHLGIAGFWRVRRLVAPSARADREFARWRAAISSTARTLLDSGGLTPLGRRFVEGIHRTAGQWTAEPVPTAAVRSATDLLAEHHRTWLRRWAS